MMHRHRSLISTLTTSIPFINTTTSTNTQTHFPSLLHQRKPSLFFTSESQSTEDPNLTLSYLINSCGLSPAWALKLSKRVHLRNPDQADAVLDLLRSFGFSETQLSLLVKRFPQVLSAKPDKTLLPKLQFFLSVGVSTADLPKILIGNAVLLEGSLANCIARRCDILKSVLGSQDEVVAALKRVPWCLTGRGVVDHLVPNTRFLRRLGVTQGPISHMVCNNLGVASVEHTRFVEAAERVREMGFDPSKVVFVDAVKVVVGTSREVWEKRLEVYERWGWSGEMCLSAFRRYPQCMFMSEGKVMRTMRFLVKDMGWPSEDILRTPGVLSPNLEKTIMPRCHVVKALKSRRLIKSDSCISSFILITEKMFLDRYVTRFQERVPVLMDIYRGRIHHLSDDVGL
ncbi:Mitochodrial transcription termination factor-related [Spatholobus suberectus]|nr:Mitochodrial transcription termination factor-related [Spatholobus suberectus]